METAIMTNYYIVDQETAKELNLVDPTGVWFSKEYTNYVTYFNDDLFCIAEEENDYGDIRTVNQQVLSLKEGDELYISDMSARDYIALKQKGINIIFVVRELIHLPLEEQTEHVKAKFVYSLLEE